MEKKTTKTSLTSSKTPARTSAKSEHGKTADRKPHDIKASAKSTATHSTHSTTKTAGSKLTSPTAKGRSTGSKSSAASKNKIY